jgi:hypothetical protein
MEHLIFVYTLLQLPKECHLSLIYSKPSRPNTSVYRNDSIGCNSNLEKPHKLNLTFWKAKPQFLSEFKSADPRLTINKHVSVLPIGTSYWMNYILRSVNVLGFTQKHWATKLHPTWQLMDVVPRLKLSNALTALTSSSVSPSHVV